MIPEERIHQLNDKPIDPAGVYVLYWMQASQRTRYNHALEYAVGQANDLGQSLLVCFGLMDDYPEANLRHYHFMVQGLADVETSLKRRDIKLVVKHGHPAEVALHYGKRASVIVVDQSYTRWPRRWYEKVADEAKVRLVQVESEIVVPVESASVKQEHAARTIRPRIQRQWDKFIAPVEHGKVNKSSLPLHETGDVDLSDAARACAKLKLDTSVPASPMFNGGETEAQKLFDAFLEARLNGYATERNEVSENKHSFMSMYLHFGHISPVELAVRVRETKQGKPDDRDNYLEELIIRRELSKNFTWYCPHYDSYENIPGWAKKTLAEHRNDERPHTYTREQLVNAETHDDYWNAACRQQVVTGFMHNYMRMYWGKKVLEWHDDPAEAYATLLWLNNRFFIDGRDPNSYGNVAWVFGQHDRAWTERSIFGKVRYMNSAGLERKFKIGKYVQQVDEMARELGALG
ncbi:MAG: deoxyribodipyrimidine photo-lyase [Phycisphaerae bacterium]